MARIGDAKLSVENDGDGGETAVGRVLIVNDGPYDVVDFRLTIEVSGSEYSLVPFEGSLRFPTRISYRRISPGGQLDVPVMSGRYRSYSTYGSKKIHLEASLDGPPGLVYDTVNMGS